MTSGDEPDDISTDDTLGELHQMALDQAAEIQALRREVRSLRSGISRILRAVEPSREHDAVEDDDLEDDDNVGG